MKAINVKLSSSLMLNYLQPSSGSAITVFNDYALRQIDFPKWSFSDINAFVRGSLTSKEWLNSEEAAEYFSIPVESLRNMTSNGKIPHYKVPGTRLNRYLLTELRALLLRTRRGE